MKHADVSLGDLPEFIDRLKAISEIYELDFVVSVSAEKEEMIGVNFDGCEILNCCLLYTSKQRSADIIGL